jgi:hypothetical protein
MSIALSTWLCQCHHRLCPPLRVSQRGVNVGSGNLAVAASKLNNNTHGANHRATTTMHGWSMRQVLTQMPAGCSWPELGANDWHAWSVATGCLYDGNAGVPYGLPFYTWAHQHDWAHGWLVTTLKILCQSLTKELPICIPIHFIFLFKFQDLCF